MGFLKRTNKKFDYQPRYYKGEGSPFKIEHKLDLYRTTTGKNKGIKGARIRIAKVVVERKRSNNSLA